MSRGQAQPWAGSDRRSRLPPDWPARRRAALHRDGHQCTQPLADGTRCPAPATDVDHVVRGDDHALSNLTSLCGPHHAEKTAGEGHAAQRARRFRPAPQHPGLAPQGGPPPPAHHRDRSA